MCKTTLELLISSIEAFIDTGKTTGPWRLAGYSYRRVSAAFPSVNNRPAAR